MFDPDPVLAGDVPSEAAMSDMDETAAFRWVCQMRWSDGNPVCPKCGCGSTFFVSTRMRFKCKAPTCFHQFSPVTGTMFQGFKGGYVGLLRRMRGDEGTEKTVRDVQRRMSANGQIYKERQLQIEVIYRTGGGVADKWESEPNLRAEIKMKIAEAMARVLRTQDLIEWDTAKTASGDFVVRGFLNAEPGTEKMIQHTVDLDPVT